MLLRVHGARCDALVALNRTADVANALRERIRDLERSGRPENQLQIGSSYTILAAALADLKEPQQALAAIGPGIAVLRKLAISDPQFNQLLLSAATLQARMAMQLGRSHDGIAALDLWLECQIRRTGDEDGTVKTLRQKLSPVEGNRGRFRAFTAPGGPPIVVWNRFTRSVATPRVSVTDSGKPLAERVPSGEFEQNVKLQMTIAI